MRRTITRTLPRETSASSWSAVTTRSPSLPVPTDVLDGRREHGERVLSARAQVDGDELLTADAAAFENDDGACIDEHRCEPRRLTRSGRIPRERRLGRYVGSPRGVDELDS